MTRTPRRRGPAEELRLAVECLPVATKTAMLEGINAGPIIVGAYVDGSGGVCPMLAAHRRGGRTSFASFARAWDRYTGARKRSRRASTRELRTLRTMLEAAIARDDLTYDLGEAVDQIKAAKARRSAHLERSRELRAEIEADRRRGAEEELAAREAENERRAERLLRLRRSAERDRAEELRDRHGWAWLRPFRRLDDYEAALEMLDDVEREVERQGDRDFVPS